MDTIVFLLFAYVGGTIGIKLKLPAGALLGSMIFIGIISIFNLYPLEAISPILRTASKIALGIMIGLMFTKEILNLPFKQLLSFILVGLGSVLSAFIIAIIFKWVGFLPLVTGLIAFAPGGIAEMLTLATSIEVDTQAVVIMHIIRFVLLMLTLRWMLKLFEMKEKLL